jgi:hypothetical protein
MGLSRSQGFGAIRFSIGRSTTPEELERAAELVARRRALSPFHSHSVGPGWTLCSLRCRYGAIPLKEALVIR